MNPFLRDVLRSNWSYNGYVTSDTDAISSANNHHNYSHDPLEAITYGLRDGECDVESSVGGTNWYAKYIPALLANKSIEQQWVDGAVKNTFRTRFQAGLFDPTHDQPYTNIITMLHP